jgi:alkylated DNA repair protein (DNA oxidative demethylase)
MTVPNSVDELRPGVVLLRGFALRDDGAYLDALHAVTAQAPFRHMVTAGGLRMSVAMTNCGGLGWVSAAARNGRRCRAAF